MSAVFMENVMFLAHKRQFPSALIDSSLLGVVGGVLFIKPLFSCDNMTFQILFKMLF